MLLMNCVRSQGDDGRSCAISEAASIAAVAERINNGGGAGVHAAAAAALEAAMAALPPGRLPLQAAQDLLALEAPLRGV